MVLTAAQRSLIERVINAAVTGVADGVYSAISIYADGPHNIRQITYGRSQTTEYGNLRTLVQMYVNAAGMYSSDLARYADRVGSIPLTDNQEFKDLLKKAGKVDPVMSSVQDAFFEQIYFTPAMKWADSNGFRSALSALVIYDSFIHSGGILWLLRQKFPESPPSEGGDEKVWIYQYLKARDDWLSNHSRKAVKASNYRVKAFLTLVANENWELTQVPVIMNGIKVFPKQSAQT